MLRLGDKIRLNAQERSTFSTLVGVAAAPTSAKAHDAQLARAKDLFSVPQGASEEALAESRLMGAVLDRMVIGQ